MYCCDNPASSVYVVVWLLLSIRGLKVEACVNVKVPEDGPSFAWPPGDTTVTSVAVTAVILTLARLLPAVLKPVTVKYSSTENIKFKSRLCPAESVYLQLVPLIDVAWAVVAVTSPPKTCNAVIAFWSSSIANCSVGYTLKI